MAVNFAQFLEQQEKPYYVKILEVDGYSSGSHGGGGYPERPAGDPCLHAKWKWYVSNPETWDVFKGKQILIQDKSMGSYHERWCNLYIYALVNETDYDKLEELEKEIRGLSHDYGRRLAKEHKFIFRDFQQMVREINGYKETGTDTEPQSDHESSDDYWKRMISSKTYNMKRKWEGD